MAVFGSCCTAVDEFLLYSHTEQHSRSWKRSLEDIWLFLYMCSLEMEMSFLLIGLSLCHFECSPYPSLRPVSLLSPFFCPCPKVFSLPAQKKKKKHPWGWNVGQNTSCSWQFAFNFLFVDWREKPAASGEAGSGWAEAAADHPQGRDTPRGGGWASPESCCPHKGIITC